MKYSIVEKSNLDNIVFRLDSEYYHPNHIALEKKLSKLKRISIQDANGEFDCSAFYPSIVPYYDFQAVGVPFLRVNEIQNGLLHITEDTAFLPRRILDENRSTIAKCKPGDLIIAKGGNSLAKVALLTEEYKEYSVCRDVVVLRTHNLSSLNRYYLWIFLHSVKGQQLLLRTASQTGQPHLTLEALKQIEAPLFSEDFQSKYEWLYNQSRRLTSLSAAKYKKSQSILFSELNLSNWKPKHQLAFVKNYSDSDKANRFDAEFFHPKYEELIKLLNKNSLYTKSIIDIQEKNGRGLQPKYDKNGSLNVITSKHILERGLTDDEFDKTSYGNWESQSRARIKKGDILTYTTGANIGRTAYYHCDEKALASNHVNILRIKEEDPMYVAFVMNSLIGRMQTNCFSSGSAQAELYPQHIEKFIIPFIEKKKQIAINKEVTESLSLRKQSKYLLEYAKQAIELAIEQGEQTATKWLKNETRGMQI